MLYVSVAALDDCRFILWAKYLTPSFGPAFLPAIPDAHGQPGCLLQALPREAERGPRGSHHVQRSVCADKLPAKKREACTLGRQHGVLGRAHH